MKNDNQEITQYVWIPISGWSGVNNVYGIDIDEDDVKAMRKLINTKPESKQYWEAVFYKATSSSDWSY